MPDKKKTEITNETNTTSQNSTPSYFTDTLTTGQGYNPQALPAQQNINSIFQNAFTQWQRSIEQLFTTQLQAFESNMDEVRLRQAEITAREEERRIQQYAREDERRAQQYTREDESRNKLRSEFERFFENQSVRQGKERVTRQLQDIQANLLNQLQTYQGLYTTQAPTSGQAVTPSLTTDANQTGVSREQISAYLSELVSSAIGSTTPTKA